VTVAPDTGDVDGRGDGGSRQMMTDAGYSTSGGELSLSGPAMADLLDAVVEEGASFRFTARGFSMRPFIEDGDVLTVRPLGADAPGVGDVVAVRVVGSGRGRLIVHRVVEQRDDRCLIRGDNCPEPDGWFPRSSIAGVVSAVDRDGRRRGAGLGRSRRRIASLSRRGRLMRAVAPLRLPRRAVGGMVRALQCVPAYRSLARRYGERVRVVEPDEDDLRVVSRRFGLLLQAPNPETVSMMLVARDGRRVVGFVHYLYRPGDGLWSGDWLFALVVWTPYRGMGLGERLASEVVACARERGGSRLRLTVVEDNRAALAMYRKLGFRPLRSGPLEEHLREQRERYERAQAGGERPRARPLIALQLDLDDMPDGSDDSRGD